MINVQSTAMTAHPDRRDVALSIRELWRTSDPQLWNDALARYWSRVKLANLDLERRMESLKPERLRAFDSQQWYEFLRDEYFPWKYTDPRWLKVNIRHLCRYYDEHRLPELDHIRHQLLEFDQRDVRHGVELACAIHGLGIAGASGLLALIYPETFATVDQFVVKALRDIPDLPERAALARMNPHQLSLNNAVLLIGIMRRRARENNECFGTSAWTPRRIDMVLWTYGRQDVQEVCCADVAK